MSVSQDKLNQFVMKADRFFIISASLVFFLALFISLWDFLYVQRMIFILEIVNILGLLLFVTGIILRRMGKRAPGKYYSYGLRTSPDQKLITQGIYKLIRHPISLAAIMYSLALPMIFSSLYGFLIMLLLIPLIVYRLLIEEKMLIDRFGDEYREYMRGTKRLIPAIF